MEGVSDVVDILKDFDFNLKSKSKKEIASAAGIKTAEDSHWVSDIHIHYCRMSFR